VRTLFFAALCGILLLTQACVSTPTGSQIDPARVAHIAGAAAYIGGSLDLSKNPGHRAAYTLAVAMLKSLEDTETHDAAALARALQGLNVREFSSPEGVIYVQVALIVWDEALRTAAPVTQAELVRLVLPQIRSGLENALASTQPTP